MGFRNGKQKYRCHVCKHQFLGGKRVDPELLWKEYSDGKQTYVQLAEKYDCSSRTIQRKIDSVEVIIQEKSPRKVIILMDTTYWGRNFGVMLFKD